MAVDEDRIEKERATLLGVYMIESYTDKSEERSYKQRK